MIVSEEKIRVIEKVLETNDARLLREIASLLYTPFLNDYPNQPMSREAFLARINQAEEAIQKGQVTTHDDVKEIISTWSNK